MMGCKDKKTRVWVNIPQSLLHAESLHVEESVSSVNCFFCFLDFLNFRNFRKFSCFLFMVFMLILLVHLRFLCKISCTVQLQTM